MEAWVAWVAWVAAAKTAVQYGAAPQLAAAGAASSSAAASSGTWVAWGGCMEAWVAWVGSAASGPAENGKQELLRSFAHIIRCHRSAVIVGHKTAALSGEQHIQMRANIAPLGNVASWIEHLLLLWQAHGSSL
jgi:hypothetical protein